MNLEQSITLHSGDLRFSAKSRGRGPLVMLLHGFPDNANTWSQQLPALAEAGFRAVAVTMRGYEPESQPADGDYSQRALANDIIGFIEQLDAKQAHLIGHDWGAAFAYPAAAQAPDKFTSLITVSVPHSGRFVNEVLKYPKQLRLSWYMFFFQLRGIAEHAVERNDFALLRRLWRDWSPDWNVPDDVMEDVLRTFRQPGVIKSALAYYRAALRPTAFLPAARAAARYKVEVPTLGIAGAQDGCIAPDVFFDLMEDVDFPAGLQVECIDNAGHFPHQERPEKFNELMLHWLGNW